MLEPNQFTDQTDPVGLFEKNYGTNQYLIPSNDLEDVRVLEST